ncbi:MAG TPA: hypothetical protein DCP28_26160 [Cytophagales bacterium]|nr:hypothetical protein [Cytophagales bacterium]
MTGHGMPTLVNYWTEVRLMALATGFPTSSLKLRRVGFGLELGEAFGVIGWKGLSSSCPPDKTERSEVKEGTR